MRWGHIMTVRRALTATFGLVVMTAAINGSNGGPSAEATQVGVSASTCTVTLPNRIDVNRPYISIKFTLQSDCLLASMKSARWKATLADGDVLHTAHFQYTFEYQFDYFDHQRLGLLTWTPGGAIGGGNPAIDATASQSETAPPGVDGTDSVTDVPLTQNTPTTDVRVASSSTITVSRPTSTTLKINTAATRYAVTYHTFIAWAGASGQIQWRVPGTTAWNALKSVASDSAGKYSYTYTTSERREYRVYYPSVPYIFGNGSAPKTI